MRLIRYSDIREITAFQLDPAGKSGFWGKSRPVFCITFTDGSKLVVKGEIRQWSGASDESARWGGKMMKQVSPSVKVNLLTPNELGVLMQSQVFGSHADAWRTFEYMCDLIGSRKFLFYKMPFADNLRSVESMTQDQEKAQKLLAKLRDDRAVLFGLAKIVAIDLFIGNVDRFNEKGAIVNPGNIVFQKNADKSYTPLGIDFFNAQGQAANLYKPPPPMWGGLKLQHQQSLRLYAHSAINSLNDMFKQVLAGQITEDQLIQLISVGTFINGMSEGVKQLKDYLTGRVKQGKKLPSGVMERLRLLKWI